MPEGPDDDQNGLLVRFPATPAGRSTASHTVVRYGRVSDPTSIPQTPLGHQEAAKKEYEAALRSDPDDVRAHLGLSRLRMPGEDYIEWLRRFHEVLARRTYLEIGVADGRTLSLARLPTVAIGIDPNAQVRFPLSPRTHLFAEMSDDFFRADRLSARSQGPVDLVFIDGAHLFEQVLRDLINVEKHCLPQSVILFHDTVPLNEVTQRRERETRFWSGDV